MKLQYLLPILIISITIVSCTFDSVGPSPCESLDIVYNDTVKGIIELHCAIAGCHVAGFPAGNFTDYTILKAKVDGGQFEFKVLGTSPSMPIGDTLTQQELDKLQCWIDDGAQNN